VQYLIIPGLIIFTCFAIIIFFGAPYLPTLRSQRQAAIELLDLPKGSMIFDIGSGDGRFLRQVAKQGYIAYGIEANPILVIVSYLVTFKYRKRVTVKWDDMWTAKWPKTDGVYVFLHTRFMEKLDKKLSQEYKSKNVKVVSYAFEIPSKKCLKNSGGMYLYEY
jgi:16S rRNA A1518/A1519 N6-dimethyltransferase RsmA/KsgA/DIM1 with predicted DNA glycosylase/AP lyase activity